jgi:hypothetical protein
MNDTPEIVSMVVSNRYRLMTPTERCMAASSMYETARRIVESSLPAGLTPQQRRFAIVRRLYQSELPDAALAAHARHGQPAAGAASA